MILLFLTKNFKFKLLRYNVFYQIPFFLNKFYVIRIKNIPTTNIEYQAEKDNVTNY